MELVQKEVITKPLIQLDDYRITADADIPADVYLAKIGNTNKFSKGNISVWTGKAKSKKTFAMTMLVSAMMGGLNLDKFFAYNKNKILWIDTEQSKYDVQKIVRRLKKIVGDESNVIMYGLRPLSPEQRIEKIEEALKEHPCTVLVIDGARDLVNDFNNATESTAIVTKIMKWSYDYNIHISTVVHQISSGKVRGHLGTELENKSESVIKVERDEVDITFSHISEVYGRGKGFEDFSFYIDDNGMPQLGECEVSINNKVITEKENDIPF